MFRFKRLPSSDTNKSAIARGILSYSRNPNASLFILLNENSNARNISQMLQGE
jgi:hypothetical protein